MNQEHHDLGMLFGISTRHVVPDQAKASDNIEFLSYERKPILDFDQIALLRSRRVLLIT